MSHDQNGSSGLSRLAQMARTRVTLIASLLALYQTQEELSDAELAAFLQGDEEALVPLALCRRPRPGPAHFRADVKQIAAYVQVNTRQLARLVRAASVYEHQLQLDRARPAIVAEADRIVERWEQSGLVRCGVCGTTSPYKGTDRTCQQCGERLLPFA